VIPSRILPFLPSSVSSSRLGSLRYRLMALRHLLRRSPFDTSTEDGRSKERYRRASISALAAGLSKGTALLTSLISVPLTLRYLGQERYGLWLTMNSVVFIILGFADAGIGNVLQNAVSTANATSDHQTMRRDVSSAFFLITVFVIFVFGLFVLAYPYIPWPHLFNVGSELAIHEAGPAVAVLIVCYLATTQCGIGYRIQQGYQEGFVAYLWDSAGSLLGLCGTLVAIYLRLGLPSLVLMVVGAPLVAGTANSVVELGWRRPWLRPRWSCARWSAGWAFIKDGFLFLSLQIGTVALSCTPVFIVANRFGAAEASVYGVVYKLLSIPLAFCALFWMPLWPAYRDALARGDRQWVVKTLRWQLRFIVLLLGPLLLGLALFTPAFVRLWTGGVIQAPLTMALSVAVLVFFMTARGALSVLLSGCGRLRLPAAVLPLSAALALSVMLVPRIYAVPSFVPLWMSVCELLAASLLLFDVRHVVFSGPADLSEQQSPGLS
jgi:O-antigen/teichoic acid export membrane protein